MIWNREPALVLAVVQALFAVATGFGLDLSTEQLTTLVALSSALLGMLDGALPFHYRPSAIIVRSKLAEYRFEINLTRGKFRTAH